MVHNIITAKNKLLLITRHQHHRLGGYLDRGGHFITNGKENDHKTRSASVVVAAAVVGILAVVAAVAAVHFVAET